MNGAEQKACIFGALIVLVYAVHQLTVGGDGALIAAVVGAIAAMGGYTVAVAKLKKE